MVCQFIIDGIEHTDAKTSSEQTDVKGSTAHGTESIPKKPPLHCKLTGQFSLKEQSVEAEENSGDGSDFCKIQEAQSENPEKPVQEIGKSKETELTSMQVTGEPPTTSQNTFTNEGENKTKGSSAELPIPKIEDNESRDSDGTIHKIDIVHKDLSDDEFNSDLVIDEGECDMQTKCAKKKKKRKLLLNWKWMKQKVFSLLEIQFWIQVKKLYKLLLHRQLQMILS